MGCQLLTGDGGVNAGITPTVVTATKTAISATNTPLPPPTPLITPSPAPTVTPTPSINQLFDSPEYGIQAFWWWHPEKAAGDLALIKEMGFGWVKHNFPWREIEGIEKGARDEWRPDFIVNAVNDAGLKLIVRIDHQPFWSQSGTLKLNRPPDDYQDFADFCGWLAERYQGQIAAYQVWNEPNLSREWGDEQPNPEAYTELLTVCYTAIKEADPSAIVISAGLATTETNDATAMPDTLFLERMYEAGAGDFFDVAGINAPGYKASPETSPEEAATLHGSRFLLFGGGGYSGNYGGSWGCRQAVGDFGRWVGRLIRFTLTVHGMRWMRRRRQIIWCGHINLLNRTGNRG